MEYRGGFRNGSKHGKGKLVNNDGRTRAVTFSKGKEVKEKKELVSVWIVSIVWMVSIISIVWIDTETHRDTDTDRDTDRLQPNHSQSYDIDMAVRNSDIQSKC